MKGLLFDTNALIWVFERDKVTATAQAAIDDAWAAGEPILVSPISAWEIGILVARDRLTLSLSPLTWIQRILSTRGVALADMSPDILIASSFLPPGCPNDPADRILAATVRTRGLTLITRDRLLLSYAEAGHIRAVAC